MPILLLYRKVNVHIKNSNNKMILLFSFRVLLFRSLLLLLLIWDTTTNRCQSFFLIQFPYSSSHRSYDDIVRHPKSTFLQPRVSQSFHQRIVPTSRSSSSSSSSRKRHQNNRGSRHRSKHDPHTRIQDTIQCSLQRQQQQEGDHVGIETNHEPTKITISTNNSHNNNQNHNHNYSNQTSTFSYWIEYSFNFQRHVVKQKVEEENERTNLLESFFWLEDAIQKYPTAKLVPIQLSTIQTLIGTTTTSISDNSDKKNHNNNNDETIMNTIQNNMNYLDYLIAGNIFRRNNTTNNNNETKNSYPIIDDNNNNNHHHHSTNDINTTTSHIIEFVEETIESILHELLKWYPLQVKQLISKYPLLQYYPPFILRERIEFLLAPLPTTSTSDTKTNARTTSDQSTSKSCKNDILYLVNITDDIDWPFLFYNDHYGAGMSVSQVSHALQALPDPFILRIHPFHDSLSLSSLSSSMKDRRKEKEEEEQPTTNNKDDNHNDDHHHQGVVHVQTKKSMTSQLNVDRTYDSERGSKNDDPYYYNEQQQQQQYDHDTTLQYLYEQTPSIVLQMTHTVLDLWIVGTGTYESVALAYLHWRGWEWQICRVMLHALPGIVRCHSEPSWELYERINDGTISNTNIRKQLIVEALGYLQMRLHLRPWHIHAMMKTHPRLSGYHVPIIQRNLNYIQEQLHMNSNQIRCIILLMPSLLGSSITSLQCHIQFYVQTVGLTIEQLRDIILTKPALLQYSVKKNLIPKYHFFTNELLLEPHDIVRITLRTPILWGRSLEHSLQSTAISFCSYFNNNNNHHDVDTDNNNNNNDGGTGSSSLMTLPEYGRIIVHVPDLLRCNWRGNIQVKLEYLQKRLQLSNYELKMMIQSSPHLLLQGITTSLETKIQMLEQQQQINNNMEECRIVIQTNPSLLLNSNKELRSRIERMESLKNQYQQQQNHQSNFSMIQLLTKQKSSNNTSIIKSIRQHRRVYLLSSTDSVDSVTNDDDDEKNRVMEFENVLAASIHAGISQSNMYNVLRTNRLLNGKRYVYGNVQRIQNSKNQPEMDERPLGNNNSLVDDKVIFEQDIKARYIPDQNRNDQEISYLTIELAGAAYPPEDTIRGRRRSGGMALHISSWTDRDWRSTCSQLWKGWRVRLLPDSGSSSSPVIILGYPYTRPSRPRCTLYACREALRVAYEWLGTIPPTTKKVYITIISDSNYVVDLLEKASRTVPNWGDTQTMDHFINSLLMQNEHDSNHNNNISLRSYQMNPDILYPLSLSYGNVMKQTKIVNHRKDVIIQFQTTTTTTTNSFVKEQNSLTTSRVRGGAQLAAKLMYDSIR